LQHWPSGPAAYLVASENKQKWENRLDNFRSHLQLVSLPGDAGVNSYASGVLQTSRRTVKNDTEESDGGAQSTIYSTLATHQLIHCKTYSKLNNVEKVLKKPTDAAAGVALPRRYSFL
jgi:hypothetical protein